MSVNLQWLFQLVSYSVYYLLKLQHEISLEHSCVGSDCFISSMSCFGENTFHDHPCNFLRVDI